MLYPEYYIYSVISMLVLSVLCLGLTIKTLQAGEEAISYGGFANEIIKNDFKARRIDNAQGEPVIQNDVAKELLKNEPILEYLEKQLSENRNNKAAFYRLQTACDSFFTNFLITELTILLFVPALRATRILHLALSTFSISQ